MTTPTRKLALLEIPPDLEFKRAATENLVRCMYELLGSNMTAMIPGSPADWRSENAFQRWRNDVFLGPVQQNTRHLLLSDGLGLRGFLSYTPSPDDDEIFINEVQIRRSCQGDAVTIRRLVQEFARRITFLPHRRLATCANKANGRSQRLATKIGVRCTSETVRGHRYDMPKEALLAWPGVRSVAGASGIPVRVHNRRPR